jgi:haloalkane dehalogenase
MIPANETFDGTFPFAPHFSTATGFQMHYVDEGKGEPIVCLHGEPTWGYLYRHFIPPLSNRYRIIVPDHMGFGKSETPANKEYTLSTHVENLEALVLELDLQDITLVLHDWGGPIGGGFALRHLNRVRRLFLMNTIVPLGLPIEAELLPKASAESKWFQWATQAYEDGSLEEVLGNAGVTILHLMKHLQGFENVAAINQTWINAYSAHFQTRADCQGIINFPIDVITGREGKVQLGESEAIAALRQKPAMMVEGMKDYALPPRYFIDIFRAGFPDAPVITLANAGHFCQEDQPDALVALIDQFIQLT